MHTPQGASPEMFTANSALCYTVPGSLLGTVLRSNELFYLCPLAPCEADTGHPWLEDE